MISACGCCTFTLSAAISPSSASTTTWSLFPSSLKPTANSTEVFSCLRRLVDLFARKARRRSIAAHDSLALLEREHVVNADEAVGSARLHRVDHPFRAALPVHAHDLRRHRQALLLV